MNKTSLGRRDAVIGRSVSRPGARRAFVRCPYAHTHIQDIDTTEALVLDGVAANDIQHAVNGVDKRRMSILMRIAA